MKHLKQVEQEFWSRAGGTHPHIKHVPGPVYRVGELFRKGHQTWPQGGQFNSNSSGPELTLFASDIGADIVGEVGQGEVELALIIELPLIVLTYRFGQLIPWSDVPYSWHLQPLNLRVIPSLEYSSEARALLWITLVGANDGIIHAQRGVTLSPVFTRSLYSAIRTQALMPFDPAECTSAIARICVSYSNVADRLALAEARTMGNE